MSGVALIWMAVVLLLALGTAALSRWLLFRDHRSAARNGALLDPASADAPDRGIPRPWIIFNPSKFEDPAEFRSRVDALARGHGISHLHWRETTPEDPGTGQTVRALGEGASVVIAAGGDGTVRAVAAGVAHSGVRMGIIPVGTGNLLARNLGLPLDDLPRAVSVALGPDHRRVDLAWLRMGDVEERSDLPAEGGLLAAANASTLRTLPESVEEPRTDEFAYAIIAGLGFDGETMANTDPKLKKTVGWPAYVISAFTALRSRRMRARLVLHAPVGPDPQGAPTIPVDEGDAPSVGEEGRPGVGPEGDETTDFTARTVLFANCGELPYIVLAPDADPDDGLLDIIAVDTQAGLIGWADLAAKVLVQGVGLRPLDMPTSTGQIAFRQAPAASVHVDRPQVVQVDGDAVGRARTVHVRVTAGALDIAVP
ncbi:MAG: hypothetical protein L0J79_01205 [Propionibacterium sp.]|nr:hypothetical protein [Propionibacterium sp.]